MFTHVEEESVQFAYLSNICVVIGAIACMFFAFTINEPKLVQESKQIYDKYFMIEQDEVNS